MIRRAVRMLRIGAVLARYRLDELLLELPPLKLARAVRVLPWGRRGVRGLARGVRLRLALQELGPIYVKFGQILSTRRDLLPTDLAEELAELQDNVPPFPGREARFIIEDELGKPIDQLFARFDETPMASASIAQVHAAELPDGTRVVAKVVRPGIEARIRDDLELLEALARLVRRYHPEGDRIRPNEVVAEFRRFIVDELDMQREGANASLLRRNWEDSDELYIPKIYWSHTANRVLVMERIGGVPVRDIDELKRRGVDLEKLARRGIRVFYTQVFRDNLFHADMHP
ncbi:MAG: AarF/UbiB family protein, partial [Wenzhouxiangellaceae bacterium]